MASIMTIKELAKSLGFDVPNSVNNEEQMRIIADQLGMDDYEFNTHNNDLIFSRLKDLEKEQLKDKALNNRQVSQPEVLDDYDDSYETLEEDNDDIQDDKKDDDSDEKKDSDGDKESEDNKESDEDGESKDNNKESGRSEHSEDDLEKSYDKEDERLEKKAHDNKESDNSIPKKENEKSNDSKASNESLKNQQRNNAKNGKNVKNDGTSNARKNLDHKKKAASAKKASSTAKGKAKAQTKEAAKKTAKKAARSVGTALKAAAKAVANFITNVLIPFLLSHPWIIIVLALFVFLAFIMFILFAGIGGSGSGVSTSGYHGSQCSYNVKGVVNTGNVTLNDVQVELINCNGTSKEYSVVGKVDLEKYVLGTALAKLGANASDEALKAQIIVDRNYALTRNSSMCPENPENCFYGYNISTGVIRLRACELDQVYWDYEKDSYIDNSGTNTKYSPEVKSGTVWKQALSVDSKSHFVNVAKEVKGKVLLDNEGNVLKITNSSNGTNNFVSLANQGMTYDDILNSSYGTSNIDSSSCSTVGNIDYGDYSLSSDGDQILHKSLSTFLSENGSDIESFNALIEKNVRNSGYGTRAGVVAAAVTLVAELGNNYGVKLPYFWGGGHSGDIDEYANATWGSSACHTYANKQNYNYCGLDCTGFVAWAIFNGGYYVPRRNSFYKMADAKKVSLISDQAVLQPGDLLESKGHVVLVIGIDNDSYEYICVEASGNEDGIWFTRRSFGAKSYWGVDMEDFYNDPVNIRG